MPSDLMRIILSNGFTRFFRHFRHSLNITLLTQISFNQLKNVELINNARTPFDFCAGIDILLFPSRNKYATTAYMMPAGLCMYL